MTIIVTTTTHFNSEAVYMTRRQAKTHCLHDHHQFCSVDYAIETLATNKIWGFLPSAVTPNYLLGQIFLLFQVHPLAQNQWDI